MDHIKTDAPHQKPAASDYKVEKENHFAMWRLENGDKITGSWAYQGHTDLFRIWLDEKDPDTGFRKTFTVLGDVPEFGPWKLDSGAPWPLIRSRPPARPRG